MNAIERMFREQAELASMLAERGALIRDALDVGRAFEEHVRPGLAVTERVFRDQAEVTQALAAARAIGERLGFALAVTARLQDALNGLG